jgi:surface polysaccharide O-acyltransferase-like enzyme
VAAKSYAATPVGIDLLGGFNTRNGPFFSTLFFVTGYYLSDRTPTPQWMRVGLLVFLGGLVVHFSEVIFLLKQYHVPAARHDYVLGTYFLGLGAAMVALSGHRSLQNAHLAALGGLTLGIYCIHILFLKMIPQFYAPRTNPVLEIALVFIVLALSAGACYLLSKVPYLRRLVV